MKHLMLTTALTTAVAFGALAQTSTDATSGGMPDATAAHAAVPAFLANDFTGKTIYALDRGDIRAPEASEHDGLTVAERDRLRWTSSDRFLPERDRWSSVGSIDDIVMTMDGEIRGVLLDVGGFLGFGARTVMVDVAELHFVAEEDAIEGIDDVSIVVAMSREQLEALPEWDGDRLGAGFEVRSYRQHDGAMTSGMTTGAAGSGSMGSDAADATRTRSGAARDADAGVFGDGHAMLEGDERTADRLMGADVYDATGENIGSVDDVVVDGDNRISDVVVDVGGFLGIGSHTVKLPISQARIGWSDADDDVRVQVQMTADQLEQLPEHDS